MKRKIFCLLLFSLILVQSVRSQCAGNCTLYAQSAVAYSPSPAGGNSLVLADDQVSGAVPIGFTFTFMCNAYTQMYVSSNGFITFNAASGSGCCSGGLLPTAGSNPNNLIAFLWTDLYPPGGGTITYSTQGTAPNRVCVITYSNIPYYPGSGSVTGQIKLFETSNNIEIHSTSASADTHLKSQGIENQAGTIGQATPGRNNNAFSIAAPDAYQFMPGQPIPNCSVPPTAGSAQSSPTTGCGSYVANFSLTGTSGTCGATYQWQSSSALAGPYTDISGETNSTAAITVSTTTYFQCVLSCGTASAASAPVNVVVTPTPCPVVCAQNCSVYAQSAISYSPSPGGGNNLVLGDDQLSAAVPIGFTFTFMCSAYTQIYVSSNGFISFNSGSFSGCCSGGVLPTAGANPNNLVAFLWTDLYPPGGGTITYSTQGTATNRVCVITYSNIPYYPGSGSVTGQIKLFETSNNIEIHSTSASADTHIKSQGIENQAGTIGQATPGRNSNAFSILSPDAYQFAPGIATCSVAPASGTAVTSPASGCGTVIATLSLSGASGTCGATYQWQDSPAQAGPYTNIAGATNPTAAVTVTATTYYQCVLACGTATASSANANISVVNPCGLPITLTKYYLSYNEGVCDLFWETATEQNSDYFLIEKSEDGLNYKLLSKHVAAGNSTQLKKYSSRDVKPNASSVTYYRLSQFDKNNASPKLSLVRTLELKPVSVQKIKIQPNPASAAIDIYLPDNLVNGAVTLVVYDYTGKKVSATSIVKPSQNVPVNLNIDGLVEGVYNLRAFDSNGGTVNSVFIKN